MRSFINNLTKEIHNTNILCVLAMANRKSIMQYLQP